MKNIKKKVNKWLCSFSANKLYHTLSAFQFFPEINIFPLISTYFETGCSFWNIFYQKNISDFR